MKKITLLLLIICFCPLQSFSQMDDVDNDQEMENTESTTDSKKNNNLVDRYFYFKNLRANFDRKENLYLIKRNGVWEKSENINFNSRGYSCRNGHRMLIENYSGEKTYEFLNNHNENFPSNYSTKRRKEVVFNK